MKIWFMRLQPLFLLVATLWLTWVLWDQWETLRSHSWQLHWQWLFLATGFMVASWALEVMIWRRWLQLLGGYLPYWTAVRIWFLSAIVRYIPGNIWQPLSMTLYCQQWGIRPETTVASVIFFQLVTLLAVAPITALYLLGQPAVASIPLLNNGWSGWLGGSLLLPVGLFLASPRLLFALLNWGLRKLGRPLLPVPLTSSQLGSLLGLAVLHWLSWGAAFATLTFALGDFNAPQMLQLSPHLVALYTVAYAIGFLSLITPSGFGVREGALYLLLTPMLDASLVTVAALLMRGWTTLGELIMAGVSALFGGQTRARATQAEPKL